AACGCRAEGRLERDGRRVAPVSRTAVREVVAAGSVRVHLRDPEDRGGEVPQDRAPRTIRRDTGRDDVVTFRSALVTGGRSGIGAAIVTVLERRGVDVRVLDLVDGFDVADPRAWDSVGSVDLACLNAGVVAGEADLGRVSDGQYRRIVGVNVDGVVFGVRRLARVMDPGSAIVVTASLAGLMEMPVDPLYALTKHAVVGFVRSAAPQLAERGIRINMVNPGIA